MGRLNYHERDYVLNTNVMQGRGLITYVRAIADRIRKLRQKRGLTQQALAAKAGVSQGTIANLEGGIRKNPRALLAIADALGASPQWLESGKGSSPLVEVVESTSSAGKSTSDTNVTTDTQSEATAEVPMKADFNPINVANTIHVLGRFLGMFDKNSKKAINGWLETLVEDPSQASDIAKKMALLAAEGQEDISTNAVINAAMKRGRHRPVDTAAAPLK